MIMRLDTLLITKGHATSRQRSKELIQSGSVMVNGVICAKPATLVDENEADIKIAGKVMPYVGRGGLKLEHALEQYPIALAGCTCMDIGASTGGFTDCMLQNHAAMVYAVDVGHDQLAEKLRKDLRVISLEGTDIRELSLNIQMDFISVDVSFISLRLVLPKVAEFLKDGSAAVILIKPQFEAGREQVGKNGLVRSPKVHLRVLEHVNQYFYENGLSLRMLCPSPIRGGSGNAEYLSVVRKTKADPAKYDLSAVVRAALSRK